MRVALVDDLGVTNPLSQIIHGGGGAAVPKVARFSASCCALTSAACASGEEACSYAESRLAQVRIYDGVLGGAGSRSWDEWSATD